MKFCQQVSHLMVRGKWRGKVEGGISHDLDRFISVRKTSDGSVVETELVRLVCVVCVWCGRVVWVCVGALYNMALN